MKGSIWDKALAAECTARQLAAEAVRKVVDAAKYTVIPGVEIISDDPHLFQLSYSALFASGSFNLSPSFYSARAQAELLNKALMPAVESGKVSSVVARLNEIAESGVIVLHGQRQVVHPAVVKAIRQSLM